MPTSSHLPFAALLAALFVTSCQATQIDESASIDPQKVGAVVWNGFQHSWTYNHRMNRLGGYLSPVDCQTVEKNDLPQAQCEGQIVHTAASGTGADEASFTSHYTELAAPKAGLQTGSVRLRFDGREERTIRAERTVTLPADGRLAERAHYDVLLNGFDVYAEGKRAKAKKIKQFRVWARGKDSNGGTAEEVAVNVGGELNMNCDSVECKQQNNRVRYTIDVRFLVIGHGDSVRATPRTFETNYTWNRKDEIAIDDIPLNARRNAIQGTANDFQNAILGFREIDFDLAKKGRYKDHWFVGWAHRIRQVDYDPTSGRASFDLDLFFKEWNSRSKRKLTSLATKGEATLRAEVVLLQFEQARVDRDNVSGTLEWRGKNRPAASEAAVWQRPVGFTL